MTVITDNATNFTSSDWTDFAKIWEFEHLKFSPYYAIKVCGYLVILVIKIHKEFTFWRN